MMKIVKLKYFRMFKSNHSLTSFSESWGEHWVLNKAMSNSLCEQGRALVPESPEGRCCCEKGEMPYYILNKHHKWKAFPVRTKLGPV